MLSSIEIRDWFIEKLGSLNEEQLIFLNQFIQKLDETPSDTIEHIYAEAILQYGETLRKLAE